MKKKGILLAAVILLSTAALVQAQAQEDQLGVTFDVTYLSSYIWRGFDVYHRAIQPSIDVDLYGTGLGLKVLSSRANASGFENAEELDISLYYNDSIYEGEAYATNYKLGWVYYNYPDNPRNAYDMQEFFTTFSWPDICPAGIVPSYTISCLWPSKSNATNVSANGGWMHIVGLGYDLAVEGLMPETPEQMLHLSFEIVYNDGVTPGNAAGITAAAVDHDWSHAVLGVSTEFDLGNDVTFTPAVYYQESIDDSVNNDDEIWCSLSMTYKF